MSNTNEQIQQALETIRLSPFRDRFSPRIYQSLGLPINDEGLWMSALSKLMQSGVLIQNYELVDPETKEIRFVWHSTRDIPSSYGEEEYKNIFITYSFAETQKNVS